jgi:hypothetical protein
MRTIEVNVHNYSELSQSAKDKVKQWYNEDNLDNIGEAMKHDLELTGFVNAELSYSLSNCQGDGVSFTGTWTGEELRVILSNAYGSNIPEELLNILPELTLKFIRTEHRYAHEFSAYTELTQSYGWITEEELKIIEQAEKLIDTYRIKVCKELEENGYADIDYHNSDEYMEETCTANDYEFFANGALA